ncbi:MAG TPA: DUF2339 domain-containing protein, partial [Polyangiaceae bacterium LLY-WYZ-15_(1-7)]|nr:DUF2339 domain-containing protein [Polyangiaceae bacterium LLY-WYZ-15_(1-7)]
PPSQATVLPASGGPSPAAELAAPPWVDAVGVGAVAAPATTGAPAATSIAPPPGVPTGASSAAATGASSAASSAASSPAAAPSGASTAAPPEPVGQAPGADAPAGDTTDATSTSAPADGGFEWERWLGVRGAAALGGLALTVAAAYFFRYSLEAGLLGPTARVILGTALGVACIAAAEGPLRRRSRVLGDWLAGAGGAVLYLAFWAASALYGMVPLLAGFAGMAAVTATCALLAVRRRAPAIAILAFLGGFATPALLSTGSDRPIALFAYLLLLDGGLLLVARARGWSLVPALALGGTALYQLLWITFTMGPDRVGLGLAIALAFAATFSAAARPADADDDGRLWRLTRFGAALLPFLFGLRFVTLEGVPLWPTGTLLLALSAGAAWLGLRDRASWMPIAAAAGSLAVLSAWALTRALDASLAWQLVALLAALGALFHALAERAPDDEAPDDEAAADERAARDLRLAAALFALGAMAGAIPLAREAAALAPFVALWAAGSLALARQVRLGGTAWLAPAGAALFALGVSAFQATHGALAPFALVGGALVAQLPTLVGDARSRRAALQASAGYALVALLGLAFLRPAAAAPPALFACALALGLLGAFAAARLAQSRWLGALLFAMAFALTAQVLGRPVTAIGPWLVALPLIATLAFLFGPLLAPGLRARPGTWRVVALAPLFFFPALLRVHEALLGGGSAGAPTLLLAALVFFAALASTRVTFESQRARRTAFVWPTVSALGFLTAAVPIQLEHEWVTITWALQAAAVLLLWKRVDHPGLKHLGLGLFAAVFVRLVLNPAVLGYHAPSGLPVLNWLAYTYLVPAAAMLVGARILGALDLRRRRPWERSLFGERPVLQGALGLGAILLGFVWLNLTIVDAFSSGRALELPFDRLPARDLTLSLAWALYGLALFALGIARKSRALRALGPGLVAITSAKVFLYDLGTLTDLWRVASLLGLAASLILVSLAYQRFVFGDRAT